MKILATGTVTDDTFIREQIAKQTIQPDNIEFYIDNNPVAPPTSKHEHLMARRERIAQNMKHVQAIVEASDCDLVWQLESDSVLPKNALEKLINAYRRLKMTNLAYVSGVQVGRHGIQCIGAWRFNEQRTKFSSIDYRLRGWQQVDATGLYCLLAGKNEWLDGICAWDGERWGPDVNFGLSLIDQGYTIFVDMELHVGHKTDKGVLRVESINTCNVTFEQIAKSPEQLWRYHTS